MQALRHCTGAAGAVAEPSTQRTPKWRTTLKYRVKKARQAEAASQTEEGDVYAGVILERYPICLPEVEQWRTDFRDWQKDWNAWKYKVPKKSWVTPEKQVINEDSPEVRCACSRLCLCPAHRRPCASLQETASHRPCASEVAVALRCDTPPTDASALKFVFVSRPAASMPLGKMPTKPPLSWTQAPMRALTPQRAVQAGSAVSAPAVNAPAVNAAAYAS